MATEEHVNEALRLFHVSTLDAARSGITANMVVTPEMRAEIQVTHQHTFFLLVSLIEALVCGLSLYAGVLMLHET